jgi:DNA repair protein RadC
MKPREKLYKFGPEKLTNHELLALILGHGTKRENVFDLSKRLISEYGNKTLFSIKKPLDFQKFYNIGKAQSAKIISCLEIGRRLYKNNKNKYILSSPDDVFKYTNHMRDLSREYIYGIYLNTRNRVLYEEVLSIGTLEQSHIFLRDIFYPAFIHYAYGIILVHNHPSGDANPSENDINITNKVLNASELLGIQLLDHVIVSSEGFFSFNDNNLIV